MTYIPQTARIGRSMSGYESTRKREHIYQIHLPFIQFLVRLACAFVTLDVFVFMQIKQLIIIVDVWNISKKRFTCDYSCQGQYPN